MAKEIYAANITEYFTKTVETTFLLREITKKETQENKKQYYDILLQDSSGTEQKEITRQNIKKKKKYADITSLCT